MSTGEYEDNNEKCKACRANDRKCVVKHRFQHVNPAVKRPRKRANSSKSKGSAISAEDEVCFPDPQHSRRNHVYRRVSSQLDKIDFFLARLPPHLVRSRSSAGPCRRTSSSPRRFLSLGARPKSLRTNTTTKRKGTSSKRFLTMTRSQQSTRKLL